MASVIPDGYHPPFATVTPTDHRAWIIIATALCMACFLFFLIIRVGLRYTLRQAFEYDDFTCWAATGFAAINSSLLLAACAKGMGKSIDLLTPHELDSIQKLFYASNVFFLLAVGLSKISVLCLIHRISRVTSNQKALRVGMIIASAWTIGSILAMLLQCNLFHPWAIVNESCDGIRTRWDVICALDIATEVGIFCLVIHLVHPLQMALGRKLSVTYIFSFRLLSIVFISLRLDSLATPRRYLSTNPFLHLAPNICYTEAQMSYVLITATVPAFRNFLKSLHTGFGGISALEHSYGYGSQVNSSNVHTTNKTGANFRLSRLAPKSFTDSKNGDEGLTNKTNSSTTGTTAKPWSLQPLEETSHNTATDSDRDGTTKSSNNVSDTHSIGSNESSRMMIRKDVNWSIRTEPRVT